MSEVRAGEVGARMSEVRAGEVGARWVRALAVAGDLRRELGRVSEESTRRVLIELWLAGFGRVARLVALVRLVNDALDRGRGGRDLLYLRARLLARVSDLLG